MTDFAIDIACFATILVCFVVAALCMRAIYRDGKRMESMQQKLDELYAKRTGKKL